MSPSAEIVARAVVAAARVYSLDPLMALTGPRQYGKVRVCAGAILVRAGLCSAAQAARLCGAPTPQKLSPTGRAQYGISEQDFHRAMALAALSGSNRLPRDKTIAAQVVAQDPGSLREQQMFAIEAYFRRVVDQDGCVRAKTIPMISAGLWRASGKRPLRPAEP
jgi:hypothetical protein